MPLFKKKVKDGDRSAAETLKMLFAFVVGAMSMYLWAGSELFCPAYESIDVNSVMNGASISVAQPMATTPINHVPEGELNFYDLGIKTGTDKVAALSHESCFKNGKDVCTRPGCKNLKCRPWGHYYHTMYQSRLGKYSKSTAEPFQFLEIGFYQGAGAETYRNFLPNGEVHSLEIACLPEGPREEGKWPWGNFAANHKDYQMLLDADRLHCGDATNVTWLDEIWNTKMKRKNAPPLMLVVDDGAHLAAHMALSVFFWFPRIQPRGLMVVEDIQPIQEANWFRTRFLPKIMADLHYCGDPQEEDDKLNFPTLHPLLASIHCEMHICIFERNDSPAIDDLSLELSSLPKDTFNDETLVNTWGGGSMR